MTLAVLAFHLMGDRRADDRNLDHVALCILDALADRFGDFNGFAETHADLAVLVADNHQRGEAEVLTALDNLCNTVDRYESFFEFGNFLLEFSISVVSHFASSLRSPDRLLSRPRPKPQRDRYTDNRRGRKRPSSRPFRARALRRAFRRALQLPSCPCLRAGL